MITTFFFVALGGVATYLILRPTIPAAPANKPTHGTLVAALTEANRRVKAGEPGANPAKVLKEWGF